MVTRDKYEKDLEELKESDKLRRERMGEFLKNDNIWFTLAIPTLKGIVTWLKKRWYRLKYDIPYCCSIMIVDFVEPYRYCSLAVDFPDDYSQRHGINCPTDCGKCGEHHHDYKW